MKTSIVVPDISHESGRPKSAWHCFVYDYPWAFAHLVSYLVEEELEECVMSRASTRLERMPFDSTDALLNYDQAHSVLISEALAVLEETADGISDGVVACASVTVSDHSDLRPNFSTETGVETSSSPIVASKTLSKQRYVLFYKDQAPTNVCGISIPDTLLVSAATDFVSSITPLWLMDHLLRSYLFAELLGRKDKMEYDQELLCLGAIMHDLGLTDEFAGVQHFALDGADAARRFLMRQGVPKNRVSLVWRAISLHTSKGIYDRSH